jgi:predicted secreted protein
MGNSSMDAKRSFSACLLNLFSLKMFNYQQELIKNQMLPKTNVYFQVTREKRTEDRNSIPSDSMMKFFNKSQPIDKEMKS